MTNNETGSPLANDHPPAAPTNSSPADDPSAQPITPIQESPRETRVQRARNWARRCVRHRASRRVAAVGSVIGLMAGLVGTMGNIEKIPNYLCRIPGIHSACGSLGIGNVASKQEQAAWEAAKKSTESRALRGYLLAYPTGVYTEEASTRLAACRVEQRETWVAEERKLPLFIAAGTNVVATVEAARAAALARGERDAAGLCAGFVGEYRVRSSSVTVAEWQCRERREGAVCGFDGVAVCGVDARKLTSEEVCR